MPEDGLLGFTIGVQRVDHAPVRGTKTKWAGTAPRPAEVAPPRRPHRIPGESHGRRSCPRFGPAPAPPTAPVRLGTKRRDRSGHISNRPGPSPRLAPNRQAPDRYRRTPSLPSRRLVVSAVTPHPPGQSPACWKPKIHTWWNFFRSNPLTPLSGVVTRKVAARIRYRSQTAGLFVLAVRGAATANPNPTFKSETITVMDSETPPPAPAKPPRVRVTPEDLDRFGDEDLIRRASNDEWLRNEAPPHHG